MQDANSRIRPWLLLRILCEPSAGWTLQELEEEFGVSQKTIRRDLKQLSNAGFPIQQSIGPHGRKTWSCQSDKMLLGLRFNFDEAAALYLGWQFLEPMAGSVFFDAAHAAFRKIRTALSKDTQQYLEQLAANFHYTRMGRSDYRQRGEIIDALMVAIEDCLATNLLYFSLNAEAPKTVTVQPYGLVHHRGSLYLIAFVPEYDELRHYKIDRIHDIDLHAESFTKPDEFSLNDHLKTAFGIFQNSGVQYHIRVRFKPEVARYVQEHHWHETQTLTPQPDGTLLLELQVSALEEFKSWVLSFGSKAVVEEPEELRELILADLQAAVLKYSDVTCDDSQQVSQ